MAQHPDPFDAILKRSERVSERLAPDLRTLSPREQLRRYQQHTRSHKWVDKLLERPELDEDGRYFLQIVREHGLSGLADYVAAMAKLERGAPARGVRATPTG